ncbi:hypothetical protein HUT18_09115 [Streptomyces sp. NA04227]|uniref:hypothetical protein n=1 Tax=Streptomyces sp. NA04227 TaxID=2742136 RepID=UPI00159277EA|nr:hypothetical protein [Streptomyces sp. NA04227]QKW06539.1 hypothetical protein HUT18_09115 [Streptomyces sp. NA04227]
MRTDDDVRDLPPFVLKRIRNSRDWDRFLVAQTQRYLLRALPEAKAREVYAELTRVAAGLNGNRQSLTPADVFARMEPVLDTLSELEDLCPPPRPLPVGVRWPKPPVGGNEVAGPLPDPWLVLGPVPDPWLVSAPFPQPWEPFQDVAPVRALPVLEALGSLAEAFSDGQAGKRFGKVLTGVRDNLA